MYEFKSNGSKLDIVTVGNPILRQECEAVGKFSSEVAKLAEDMLITLKDSGGIGIAAPQVGRSLSLCIVDIREIPLSFRSAVVCEFDNKKADVDNICPLLLINPVVDKLHGKKIIMQEGCLSIPNRSEEVERYDIAEISFDDTDGNRRTMKATGILSRCMQHEIDHLYGVLYIDKIAK
jgi:peptide deformylase